jgi:protein HIRA/HIR1
MVVVELPLWVAHSSENVGQSAALNNQHEDKDQKRAMDSLQLLEGLGGTQKCAIYSIDVHPEGKKFATGGGDGTVRIWNAGALFVATKKTSRYKEGGTFESSGESSAEECSHGATTAADEASVSELSVDGAGEEDIVHDLSSLVRRKKDGESNTANKVPVAATPSTRHPHHHPHHQSHSHHRLLCTLSAHTGSSVLAVRFSTNGQYLASAGDDSAVCIYAPASNSAVSKANLDSSVEHWTRIKLGRGHALDVVGLAWAPDDSHLVSCSLDSNTPIIVWKLTDLANSDHHPTHSNVVINPFKIIGKGIHTSTVKGVTFDPAGTYLASSGDDPSVCVWRAHDDWGLEKRIDASSGIFRRWNEADSQSLSSQSLFRRLSWSTDGAYICSTNAVVKNKHVASTISREGWAVSNAKTTASGAANLVGHKQPVVACRHCPQLLDARPNGANDDDNEPEYATMVALGDKRGFVTVWSTRQSRPIFKIQCSEARCTVTDLAWGRVNDDIMLLVSLLDGQVVALRFGVEGEVGKVLKPTEQARVFQLRYGIDLSETDMGRRRLFVGGNSGPKLIENSLQFTLEDEQDDDNDFVEARMGDALDTSNNLNLSSADIKASQSESRSKSGKKRIQPLLMSVEAPPNKVTKTSNGTNGDKYSRKKVDSLEDAMELAEKAAVGANAVVVAQTATNDDRSQAPVGEPTSLAMRSVVHHPNHLNSQLSHAGGAPSLSPQIPYSTDRVHSVDLPIQSNGTGEGSFTADCTNSFQIPHSSKGGTLPCTTLTISRLGQQMYKDQLPGTSCSAIAASKSFLAIGTVDGCVQLYGTSPTLGWKSGHGFRSHPPFVFSRPIVALKLHDSANTVIGENSNTELLVVSADGTFGVYLLNPGLKVRFKGSILPPMSHMLLSSDASNELQLPKLTRIQLTETDKLLLLLSLNATHGRSPEAENLDRSIERSVGVGGSLQAFVYDPSAELWMRVADSRFILSDFYTMLPSMKSEKSFYGELSKLDDSVRLGSTASTLKASRRGRTAPGNADGAYHHAADAGNDMVTRSHCEDRLACAIALNSECEFECWLSMYARVLSMSGSESGLRLVVDMLVGPARAGETLQSDDRCWWLSQAPKIMSLDRVRLIKTCIIPEMSKNRSLQRITNEIALEVESMTE